MGGLVDVVIGVGAVLDFGGCVVDWALLDAIPVDAAVADDVTETRDGAGEDEDGVATPPPPEHSLIIPMIAAKTMTTHNHARFQMGGLGSDAVPLDTGATGSGFDG